MTEENTQEINDKKSIPGPGTSVNLSGQLTRKPAPEFIRVLLIVTGVALIMGLWTLIMRYLVVARKSVIVDKFDDTLRLNSKQSIFFNQIKTSEIILPAGKINSVQIENRVRHLHLIVGFGFLVAGLFAGIHWLLNGLGAGYPYLALIGALVIIMGVVLDLILFLFVPESEGVTTVIISTPGWTYRITGTDATQAEIFVHSLQQWFSKPDNSSVDADVSKTSPVTS